MCNFETSYLHFNSIVVTTSRLQFWNQTQYFLRFTRHFAPWCSCLWCGLRLSDFGHKTSHGVPSCHKGKKVRLLFSSWATAPVWVSLFSFSPEALTRLQKKRHMLVAVMFSSNGPSAVNNRKTEPAITSWKILHYQRWQPNLRSHCRQTVACYSPLFFKF